MPPSPPQGPQQNIADVVKDALQKIDELTEAIRDLSKDTKEETREKKKGPGDLGFIGNMLRKQGVGVGKDVAAGMLGDAAKFGSDFSFSTSFGSQMMKAGAEIPFLNDLYFSEKVEPREAAAARTMGVIGPLARMGKFDPEDPRMVAQAQSLNQWFLRQEQGAFAAKRWVEQNILKKGLAGSYWGDFKEGALQAGGFIGAVAGGYMAVGEVAIETIHGWLKKMGANPW